MVWMYSQWDLHLVSFVEKPNLETVLASNERAGGLTDLFNHSRKSADLEGTAREAYDMLEAESKQDCPTYRTGICNRPPDSCRTAIDKHL